MEYNKYLSTKNEYVSEDDLCMLTGTCSPSPTVSYLHELVFSYVKELSFYLLKLKELGIANQQIQNDILKAASGLIINVEYSETQFFATVNKLYSDLVEAKELYISVCNRNSLHANVFKSKLKMPNSFSYSDAIAKGQKLFKKKHDLFSPEHINLLDLVSNVLKSLCVHLLELKGLGFEDEEAFDAILKLLSLNGLQDSLAQSSKDFLDEFAEIDNQLLMKLFELKTQNYGHMTSVKVSTSTRPNKAILVSGTNLKELELLLEATKDKNIDVYTHGHMITAHSYPFFRKYKHLVGHYGKSIEAYLVDFAAFPGVIFMTKHSLKTLKSLYRSRVFTSDVIAPKGVVIVKDNNFEALIESALSAKGFTHARDGVSIELNVDENQLFDKISQLAKKVDSGDIKNLFTIGVSSHTKAQKEYFDKFLSLLKDDSFVLSFSYTNKKSNVLLVETDYGFPILFKSLKVLASKRKISELNLTVFSTRCEAHTLSSVIYLKSLGVKNIYFGDCPPSFLNPALINAFRDFYGLKEYTTPAADLANILNNK